MMDTGPTKQSQECKLSLELHCLPTENRLDELALSVLASHLSGSCYQIFLKNSSHSHASICTFPFPNLSS